MRLPSFIKKTSPIGETLEATEAGSALLKEEVAWKNRQLSVSTADTGLALWEADYGLPSEGDETVRRARILMTLTGGRTLTVEELKRLARTVGGADECAVTEKFERYQVILSALFHGAPGDLTALREAVERRAPAHLNVRVQTSLPARDVAYYGMTGTPLCSKAYRVAGATSQNHVLFAGGDNGSTKLTTVSAYDADLSRSAPADLPVASTAPGGTGFLGCALFAGGMASGTSVPHNRLTVYDMELVRSNPSSVITSAYSICCTRNANYAICAGGYTNSDRIGVVNAFDSNFSRSRATDLSVARSNDAGGACVGGYACVFGGCAENEWAANVDAYDDNLSHVMASDLPFAWDSTAASVGGYAVVFVPAETKGAFLAAYDRDLTKTVFATFSEPNIQGSRAAALDGNVVFGYGAGAWDGAAHSRAYVVNDDLTCRQIENTGAAGRWTGAAAPVGEYALFGGGKTVANWSGGSAIDSVDVYTLI